ncbi:SIR2 family protein [Candidatus Falkowbacteria bacterium]|nr:SIR2 family protein [Candidatus Falkowbacteria bacterium]
MTDIELLETVMAEVGAGRRIPYLGPEVSALSGGQAPGTTAELCRRLEAEVRVPRRAAGNLWAVAQYVESRRFRATLEKIVRQAFAAPAGPNPVFDWLARLRPPMVVDVWYDGGLIAAYRAAGGSADWGWVQGVSRNGEWDEIWFRSYDATGALRPGGADPAWPSLIYKPHGLAAEGTSFLMSDSDYVEVLTEIDIQSPIPDAVQARRGGRGFLFLGCRFDDQMLRTFARQITKRSGGGHVAVIEGPLTRMEGLFLEELGITRLDLPLSAVVAQLAEAAA